ncbi:hypothetical protein DM02DRAFT_657819 [Periconia macrospinosa]|uniref:Uncharacterized protein n=1 Tax=Periconia macrospinosa TaxID=97972 RepID=A0A2V1DIL5_9PLEO|nr:hypothetical protein DM02DRAFT_657819 [Periconia macrospinosa]
MNLSSLGPTTRATFGYVVLGRSGDKSSDCNLGLFVRHHDEYDWLGTLLNVENIHKLLGRDDKGKNIDRYRGFNATN